MRNQTKQFGVFLLVSMLAPAVSSQQVLEKELHKVPRLFTAGPLAENPNDNEVQKLQKALYNERVGLTERYYQILRSGHEEQCRVVLDSARSVRSVGLEIFTKPEEKARFLKDLLDLHDRIAVGVADRERIYKARTHIVDNYGLQLANLREFRLETQIELAKIKKNQNEK